MPRTKSRSVYISSVEIGLIEEQGRVLMSSYRTYGRNGWLPEKEQQNPEYLNGKMLIALAKRLRRVEMPLFPVNEVDAMLASAKGTPELRRPQSAGSGQK